MAPTRKRARLDTSVSITQEQTQSGDSSSDSETQGEPGNNVQYDAEGRKLLAQETRGYLHDTRGQAWLHAMARPAKTSSNTLSDLFDEPFERTSYLKALDAYDAASNLNTNCESLQRQYEARYQLWQSELLQGFSLLFHGLGSKRLLLNHFCSSNLTRKGYVVVANAYAAGVAVTDILSEAERLLDVPKDKAAQMSAGNTGSGAGASLDRNHARATALCQHLEARHDSNKSSKKKKSHQQTPPRLFVVIHNLDAPTFRSAKVKSVLVILAACPYIHLIASVDHVKAMLLFPSALAGSYPVSVQSSRDRGFAFLYHHTPTFRPYTQETLHSGTTPSLFPPTIFPSFKATASTSSAAKMASALAVLASLQTNAKELFRHLANTQISRIPASASSVSDKQPTSAIKYDELLETCKRSFWANNESQMESLLLEFRDHEIIKGAHHHPMAGREECGVAQEALDAGANGWLWVDMGKVTIEGVLERLD